MFSLQIHSFAFGPVASAAEKSVIVENGFTLTIADNVTPGTFQIEARTACGSPRITGGDTWTAYLVLSTDATYTITVSGSAVTDLGTGRYRCTFKASRAGVYNVEGVVNGGVRNKMGSIRVGKV